MKKKEKMLTVSHIKKKNMSVGLTLGENLTTKKYKIIKVSGE